ncbi:hypothetical protein BV898_05592 [Hypsibius exemplaris]|uniref:Uncharacterized protein n=1 Tax=Hypsibius exemplaris TaxID=2072580 RepID=A0A1W0WYM4_HYPEX|nr:hypothetical protein BV898_05592 [Hypsibius exemplaris]
MGNATITERQHIVADLGIPRMVIRAVRRHVDISGLSHLLLAATNARRIIITGLILRPRSVLFNRLQIGRARDHSSAMYVPVESVASANVILFWTDYFDMDILRDGLQPERVPRAELPVDKRSKPAHRQRGRCLSWGQPRCG